MKEVLALFTSHSFSSTGWERNALAHKLAAEARQKGGLLIIDVVPDRLRDMMIMDCNHPSRVI